jgi:hypothetical protein
MAEQKLAVLALLLACWLVAPSARADGTSLPFPGCGCGGNGEPPPPSPCGSCPYVKSGVCEGKDAGAECSVEGDGTCLDLEPLRSTCPALLQTETGERPTTGDAGTPILYCVRYTLCYPESDQGGCRVGGGTSHRSWLAGLPVALMFGGIFLLVADRRRRRHGRRRPGH